jgi:hypothetical protein
MREAVFLDDVSVFIDGVLRSNVCGSHAYEWDGLDFVKGKHEGVPVSYIIVD